MKTADHWTEKLLACDNKEVPQIVHAIQQDAILSDPQPDAPQRGLTPDQRQIIVLSSKLGYASGALEGLAASATNEADRTRFNAVLAKIAP